ncbi:hypothetical protein EV421DRAFT_2041173 [Armillaria borealis]|uniref:Uncharacterized protein n=1 Tax=Armillaria borealis TaxID=47425 RepID=A0AA39IWD0_9AGAR|nr:hypothetical protein EV421DRAFT_2041173 [Armillaria borealis]
MDCDRCVLSLNIPDDSQAKGIALRLYQHLRMFGVITGLDISSTMTIRFATADQAATALQAIRNPMFCSNIGARITVAYMPENPFENLKDQHHPLEERVPQQEAMAKEFERKIDALCDELSLARARYLEQSERYKLQLENESKAFASLRQQLEESLASQEEQYAQKSHTLQRIIDVMKEELHDMDLNLEMRNKVVEEKYRQLMASSGKYQRECGELTSEVKRLEEALKEEGRKLEMLESVRDSLKAEEQKKRDMLERNESEKATKDSLIKVLHARIDELKERNKVLRGAVMHSDTRQLDLEVKLSASMTDKAVAEKRIKDSDTKVAMLKEELAIGINEKKKMLAEVAALRSDLAQMKTKSEGRDSEFRRLRATLDVLLEGMSTVERHRLLGKEEGNSHEAGWSNKKAIQRALVCMDEFEETQFSRKGKTLTFKDIPSPVLNDLSAFWPRDITKKRVDKFFVAAEADLGSDRYWELLERMYKAFRKERWEKRGLLESISDQQLVDGFESARDIVLRAVRPLWRG